MTQIISPAPLAQSKFYQIVARPGGRVELVDTDDAGRRSLLYAANLDVVEHYLFALLGDDVRDDLGLPYLDFPAAETDLNTGYSLGVTTSGHRVLAGAAGPVAATFDDAAVSLATLVPLSHYLHLSLTGLKQAFLDEEGKPLLRGDRYA